LKWTGASVTYGGEEIHTGFLWGDLWESDHLEDLGIDGRIILNRIVQWLDGGMVWIDLAHGRDK
jgi:hypothetical protein